MITVQEVRLVVTASDPPAPTPTYVSAETATSSTDTRSAPAVCVQVMASAETQIAPPDWVTIPVAGHTGQGPRVRSCAGPWSTTSRRVPAILKP